MMRFSDILTVKKEFQVCVGHRNGVVLYEPIPVGTTVVFVREDEIRRLRFGKTQTIETTYALHFLHLGNELYFTRAFVEEYFE